jgi:hypothetical protein
MHLYGFSCIGDSETKITDEMVFMKTTFKRCYRYVITLLLTTSALAESGTVTTLMKISRQEFAKYIKRGALAILESEEDSLSITLPWPEVYALEERGVGVRILKFDINDAPSGYSGNSFPTYNEVMEALKTYASSKPDLCTYEVIGKSQNGKDIPKLMIGNKKNADSVRASYWISGATHGNEEMGTVAVMELVKFLIDKYEPDDNARKMVDNGVWHLVPIFNVDGYIAQRRTLSNGDDPNRSFGWQVGYKNGDDAAAQATVASPLSAAEIQAYTLQFSQHPCLAGIDLHTGEVKNYAPWFADHDIKPEDQDAYADIAKYFTAAGDGNLVNGGDLEKKGMPGIQTDYAYFKSGTLSQCLEITTVQNGLPSDASMISSKHVQAFQNVFFGTQTGVAGKVWDNKSKLPLYARITVSGHGAAIYSTPQNGVYIKYIRSSAQPCTVNAYANGYKPVSVIVKTLQSSGFTMQNIEMETDRAAPITAMSLECIRCYNYLSLTEARACLGIRDNNATKIQANGSNKAFVVIDFGSVIPLNDVTGNDLTVVTIDKGSYAVFSGKTLKEIVGSEAKKLGTGSGTAEFDLKNTGVDSIRYVKIEAASGSILLDAVELQHHFFMRSHEAEIIAVPEKFRIKFKGSADITLRYAVPAGAYMLALYTVQGRLVRILARGYAAARTENEVTFTMERRAGLRGYLIGMKTARTSLYSNLFIAAGSGY